MLPVSAYFSRLLALLGLAGLFFAGPAAAQTGEAYDPSWYDAAAPHVRIAVAADGVYRVSGQSIRGALPSGTTLSDIAPQTLRLIENGREVPIQLVGTGDGSIDAEDVVVFVGRRNRGTDELWAYNYNPSAQSSTYRSLYTDTTYYWLTWGGPTGLRYSRPTDPPSPPPTSTLRDTLRAEQDQLYYYGRSFESGSPLYTPSEGYYWRKFSHTATGTIAFEHTLPVGRRVADGGETLDLTIRLDTETSSCHRVGVEAALTQGSDTAFESLGTVEWRGFERVTFEASVAQDRVPSTGLRLRVTSYNENFSDASCPPPSSTPNFVLLDWIEATYTRSLTAQEGAQRLVAPSAQAYTFQIDGYSGTTAYAYNAADARRFEASLAGGTGTFSDTPTSAATPYWVVDDGGFHTPAAVLPDTPSDWANTAAHGADYVILTTTALLPTAQQLADFRRTQRGFDVEIAIVQDVFDEFDYGRPTPIAIRRFVRTTQQWEQGTPRFLAIFGDAQFPIYTDGIDERRPSWNVPSYGFSPSDGWFAMQSGGPEDWSETIAIGRIPVRTNAQAELFLDKLRTYETAPPGDWQKRMLLLAGGVSESEQRNLQFYSDRWGEQATGTPDSLYAAGMDTLRYYKRVTSALDASFQDSLAIDLRRGAGWLNYFGHSAAQTWEIVTDPPEQFDNAGRLPMVVSLGCRTGSFAGGRFEVKSAPSLGEQLVVGSLNPDGTPRGGARNGGIAHWGTSALGNIQPSAQLNEGLVNRVFRDTMRVLGLATRQAKAEVAASFGQSSLYVRHLLQYGLLGDPATRLAIPAQPDLHLAQELITVDPVVPTPSRPLTVAVRLRNRGLVPADSVDLTLTWERPAGDPVQRQQRLPRFALERIVSFPFELDERAIGTNTFRATADPANVYAEVDELDNTAERTQVVFDTGLELIAPTDQGIVRTVRPTLRVNLVRRSAEQVPVRIQLDSVPSFDSPFRVEHEAEVSGVKLDWQPDVDLTGDETYYWRARLVDESSTTWRQSSFTVRTGFASEGWIQRGRLFTSNTASQVRWTQRARWQFDTFARRVFATSERGNGAFKGQITLDGTERYGYLDLGFGVVVVDGITGQVKGHGSYCTFDVQDQFLDDACTGGVEQDAAVDLMRDLITSMAPGDYVFIRTRHLGRDGPPDLQAQTALTDLLRTLGTSETYSQAIDTLTYFDLWLMQARKGAPDATVERASDATNEITLETELSFPYPSGMTTTPLIGPVSEWKTLRWQARALDADDDLRIRVLSRDSTVLIDDLSGFSGSQSLAGIDAAAHPYLRLQATFSDSTVRTAPELDEWSVTYTGVSELAADPAALQAIPDTLQEGADLSFDLPVTNLGVIAAASVRVRYQITDASNVTTTVAVDTLGALAPGAEQTSSLTLSTSDRVGANLLAATVESDGPPERVTYNNTVLRNFVVQSDQRPPELRVLAEGRELPPTPIPLQNLQDDQLPFVSTQPEFEILVSDENAFFLLSDTSFVEIYLKPGEPETGPVINSDYRRIPFAGSELDFQPPDDDGPNKARILFRPALSNLDTLYTLKVEARDGSGNELEPYQVSFRVQQEQAIEDLYPYPNPMNTHTTFAFRVKGGRDGTLRNFRLRIYTLSGRLVREFGESDLTTGSLNVGWNMLQWDGRDADGDRVATGVYLYRVQVEGENGTFEGDIEKVAVIR